MEIDLNQLGVNLNDPDLSPWDGDLTPPPNGRYRFRIESAEYETSKKGTPQVKVVNVIVGTGQYQGKKITSWWALTDSKGAKQRLMQRLNAVGVPLDTGQFSTEQLIGKEYTAEVKSEESTTTDDFGNTKTSAFASVFSERAIA